MSKQLTLILGICMLFSRNVTAQYYNGGESALGVRLGGAAGITYKKFTSTTFAYEAILSQNFDPEIESTTITALFEKHAPLLGEKFSAMIGAGPSYIFNNSRLGVAGTLGFDWRLGRSPINLQVDWTPAYFFVNDNRFSLTNTAFSIRYIINHRKLYPRSTSPQQQQPVQPVMPVEPQKVPDSLNNH